MNLTCPNCNATNPQGAKFCNGCGVAFVAVPAKKPHPLVQAGAIIVGLMIILAICGSMLNRIGNTPTDSAFSSSEKYSSLSLPQPSLKLLSMRDVASSEMYFSIIGEIQNDSTQKIDSLSVIVTTYDKSGGIVGTESGLVDFDSLVPNQNSAFKVVIKNDPAINNYKVFFKNRFGEQINFTDARQAKTPTGKKKK